MGRYPAVSAREFLFRLFFFFKGCATRLANLSSPARD